MNLKLLLLSCSGWSIVLGFAPSFHRPSVSHRSSDVVLLARRQGGRGPARVIEQKPPMNEEIEPQQLRVTMPNPKGVGKDIALGIMSRDEALAKAKEMGDLDLILVNASSDPAVCKIADYSKYRYEKEKKAKELKKNSKASELKEVKMSYKIDVHDYNVRKKNASKFLTQGNRVKCTVMFRGREVQHDKLGFDLLDKLAVDLEKTAVKDGRAKREGRNLSLILSPRPEVLKKVNEGRRAQEKSKKKQRETAFKEKQAAKEEEQNVLANKISLESEGLNESDDEDENFESALDELLGGDDLGDDLFK